jgi:hypothetical protein
MQGREVQNGSISYVLDGNSSMATIRDKQAYLSRLAKKTVTTVEFPQDATAQRPFRSGTRTNEEVAGVVV